MQKAITQLREKKSGRTEMAVKEMDRTLLALAQLVTNKCSTP